MMSQIAQITQDAAHPEKPALQAAAALLEQFVARYRSQLTWADFPLPQAAGQVLCSYRLHGESGDMLCLELQAINGGVRTPIHDHGTWAVLVAVMGSEHHQLFRTSANATQEAQLQLDGQFEVDAGHPLVLEAGVFHRMTTTAPALQLHLYGKPLEYVPVRRLMDEESGRIVTVPAVV